MHKTKTNISKLLLVSFISLITFSCFNTENNIKASSYKKAVLHNQVKTNKVLVIPREGCGGCISEATYFIVENQERLFEDVTIVFTGVEDVKLLVNQIGNDFLSKKNVIIDKENYFQAPRIASSYPQLIIFDYSNRLRSISDFSTSDQNLKDLVVRKQ